MVLQRYFVPKQYGYEGTQTATSVDNLTLDDGQITFRKTMLSKYLVKLVTAEYDANFIKYIDWVGKIHTSHAVRFLLVARCYALHCE